MTARALPPTSATNLWINSTALLLALAALAWLVTVGEGLPAQQAAFVLILAYAAPIVALEAIWMPSTGPGPAAATETGQAARIAGKLLGLAATLALMLFIYWLLPEYRGDFYDRYYHALRSIAPWFAALSLPYVIWIDRRRAEHDGYWHMGQLVLLRWRGVDRAVLSQHVLGWLVKLFFLPLMYTYLVDKIGFYRGVDFNTIFGSFKSFYDFTLQSLFFIDLLIACAGYVMTFKATDSHIRSTEPTLLGWFVALLCYQPFWSFVSTQYLDYGSGKPWGNWFWEYQGIYAMWGSLILLLTAVYAWSTLCFGIRFSNLTHRGILTNGPYRYCKHPAYVSKNLSWWLISMPFMLNVSVGESLRHCCLLLLLNCVYLLRARTEERHLSQDPVYCAYARYIEEHGWFRRVSIWLPALRFAPGHLFATALESPVHRSNRP